MTTLSRALEIAHEAHDGQVDKAGRPYIEHVLRVVDAVEEEDAKIVAALHDVTEDHPDVWSRHRLLLEGFEGEIVRDVAILAKPKEWTYRDYVANIATQGSARAIAVKKADLRDNADPARLAFLPEADQLRLSRKYAAALARLEATL